MPRRPRLFAPRADVRETVRISDLLRQETVGGMLLLGAAAVAVIWANTPWRSAYTSLRELTVGPSFLGLDLDLAHWSSDGLLAIFFFVVGLELMQEFRHGDLRDPARAAVPIVAAASGVAVPAVLYTVVQLVDDGALVGWAVPAATDIAFALAVLAVIGSHLPSALRTFLLTLAVVDDLIAITIIAIFYTSDLHLGLLALTVIPLAAYAALTRTGWHPWWVLVPLGVLTWVLMLRSGIHATIAGVLLGLLTPTGRPDDPESQRTSLSARLGHLLRPVSAGLCVPVFAFFAAGVTVVGGGFGAALRDPVTLGVVIGLVCGKTIGVLGSTFLMSRLTRADLGDDVTWTDMFGLSMLAGVGFTVSLLIGELAFGDGSATDEHVRLGVLGGSVIAACLASVVLLRRNRFYRERALAQAHGDAGATPE